MGHQQVVNQCTNYCAVVADRKLIVHLTLTPELLVVGWDHHRQLPGIGIMQTREKLLLSCAGEEIFLLLVACQVCHPGSDVCYYENLKKD